MNKINFAMVIVSTPFQDLITTTLRKNDVVYTLPLPEEDKYLNEYVKKNASEFSNHDAAIIDIGALKDTDDEVMEAIESIRFLDDSIRIIILQGTKEGCFTLLNQCFLNGIYNLILSGSYMDTRDQFEKCVLYGMSYKDALIFRDEDAFKKANQEKANEVADKQKSIQFSGTVERSGVTHCAIVAAYTLRKCGYIVALADYTGSNDYIGLMRSYDLQLEDEKYFTLNEIDFYINPESPDCIKEGNAYNYVLYDTGKYGNVDIEGMDESILLCGSKPWEIGYLSAALKCILEKGERVKYLFNFTSQDLQTELWKMMKEVGVEEKDLFIMEYLPNPFSESTKMMEILGGQKKKPKKRFFSFRGV